jgi:hypothetical protein
VTHCDPSQVRTVPTVGAPPANEPTPNPVSDTAAGAVTVSVAGYRPAVSSLPKARPDRRRSRVRAFRATDDVGAVESPA